MVPRIVNIRHIGDFRIWLRFEDGIEGEIDLEDELWGEVFEPLADVGYFGTGWLNRELNTVCWDNGADFAPEFLYECVLAAGVSSPVQETVA